MNENDNYIYQTIALESERARERESERERERNVFHPAKQSRLNFCSGGLSDVQGNCRGAGECGFILSLELRVPLRPATHIYTGTTLGYFYHSTSNLSGLRPGSNSLSHYPPHPETNFEVSLRFSGGGRLLRRGPRPLPITEPLGFRSRDGGREAGSRAGRGFEPRGLHAPGADATGEFGFFLSHISFCHIWSTRATGSEARTQMVGSQSEVSYIPAQNKQTIAHPPDRWVGQERGYI